MADLSLERSKGMAMLTETERHRSPAVEIEETVDTNESNDGYVSPYGKTFT